MTNPADFTPEQVADAIGAGLREGRRPARMYALAARRNGRPHTGT